MGAVSFISLLMAVLNEVGYTPVFSNPLSEKENIGMGFD